MTLSALLIAVSTYGPSIISVLQRIIADIESGKGQTTVTSADLAELAAYAANTSASLYAAAGVTPPPPAPPTAPAPKV